MQHQIETVRDDVESASEQVAAICELLAAARGTAVHASAITALLLPVSRKLSAAAGDLSDHLHRSQAIGSKRS
ncbi:MULTISPECIES: hypothetical protein [Delftia]|jgi:hypothetical protein|uniref:Methyl-accepting chemotaxis protein n=2 Tax=Delftia TaxID=80865 RepID=A0AAX3ST88_9BURK|nr:MULTISPECIES: hypothetical protein [Delftia]PZP65209.1 MAG: hypothetical protein DI604_25170 [Delftia acidovorans]EPD44465.1 hypothetical protein HMPREF9701_00045 [Delftia acidovorans CCUG 274B]KLO58737.1 hypothetical protein AA671_15595 [Delftia tsuruhatensis]MBS3722604.1 hypothetical protein [Delftia sp. PE138]MDC2862180.1 hypothetical protein [Delftia sp. DT-2]